MTNRISATSALTQLKTGQLTSQTLHAKLLKRIQQHDEKFNAFITTYPHAEQVTSPNGQLAGLPISVKDQFHVQGTQCSFGLDNTITSTTTAPFIAKLLEQGAQLLGKTSLPPYAMDFQTRNRLVGTTNNPWDLAYTVGGSSGGGAAAVAAGMSLVDIGTDLAGSLRIPASYCGVYSLLPTQGSVSNQGMFVNPNTHVAHFARPGPICQSPDDLALIWQAYSNKDIKPMASQPLNLSFFTDLSSIPLDDEIRALLNQAIKHWQQAGHQCTQSKPRGFSFEQSWQNYGIIMGYEISRLFNPALRWLLALSGYIDAKASPHFLQPVLQGYRASKSAYQAALAQRASSQEDIDAHFNQYDAWLLPVTPCRAFKHRAPDVERGYQRKYKKPIMINGIEVNYLDAMTAYTTPISLLGNPVVTIPIGLDSNGLPIGLQVVGKKNQEQQLIAIVKQLSRSLTLADYPNY